MNDQRESSTDTADQHIDPHADKYNDPRVSITRRGILIGVVVAILGVVGAAGSIYSRRTRLEKSRKFWGDDTITALQLAERMELVSVSGKDFELVDLSGTPGLGHLRHALLDERNYVWESVTGEPMSSICGESESYCVALNFSDPTARRFTDRSIVVDMKNGWVGHAAADDETIDAEKRVQLTERYRPAMKKFLETMVTVQQQRYDNR